MIYLSDLTKAPFVLEKDPATIDFDFSQIKPSIFNENRIITFKQFEFTIDDDKLKISNKDSYTSFKEATPKLNDDNKFTGQFDVSIVGQNTPSEVTIEYEYIEGDNKYTKEVKVDSDSTSVNAPLFSEILDKTIKLRSRIKYDGFTGVWSDYLTLDVIDATIVPPTISITKGKDSKTKLFNKNGFSISLSDFDSPAGYSYKSTDYIVEDKDGKEVWSSKDDSDHKTAIDIPSLDGNTSFTLKVRYNGTDSDDNDDSSPYQTLNFKTCSEWIDDLKLENMNDNQDVTKSIKVDGGNTPDTGTLKVEADLGDISIDNYDFTWSLPDLDEDTSTTIKIWLENSDGDYISNYLEYTITILDVNIKDDQAIVDSDILANSVYTENLR